MIKCNLLLLLCMGMMHMGTHAIEQESAVVEQENAPYEHILKYVPSRHYIPAAVIVFIEHSGLSNIAYEMRHEKVGNDFVYEIDSWGDRGLEIVEAVGNVHFLWTAIALGYAVKHKKYAYVPGLLSYASMATSMIPFEDKTKFFAGSALLVAGYLYDCYQKEQKCKKTHTNVI